MFLATLYFVLPLMDVLLSAEVSGLPGGDRLDCVRASDQCLKEQSCSTKYRTLRQCVAGKESNFSRATGLEAKDECKSAMEALKQKSLYNCRCKRGMKKEKNCLRIYWSMNQSLQGYVPQRFCRIGTTYGDNSMACLTSFHNATQRSRDAQNELRYIAATYTQTSICLLQ